MEKNGEGDVERLCAFGLEEKKGEWSGWVGSGWWIQSGVETAGWMRSERRSMSRMSEKLRMVRVLGLLLSGRCGTREI